MYITYVLSKQNVNKGTAGEQDDIPVHQLFILECIALPWSQYFYFFPQIAVYPINKS